MKPPAICSKAPPSMRITSCGRGRPGHQRPGRSCQMTFKEIPVAAIDSMMTHGMVSKPPIPVIARIEYQGVCVGQAVTATIEMTNPNAKTIPYYEQAMISFTRGAREIVEKRSADIGDVFARASKFQSLQLQKKRVWLEYLPTTLEPPCIVASSECGRPRIPCK